MNLDRLSPGHYAKTNQQLIAKYEAGVNELIEDWLDEASQAALAGCPEKAGYIEWMIGRSLS